MRLLKRASLFLLLTTLVTTSVFWYAKTAYGVTRTWDGGGRDANWNNALNWSDNTVPTASDVARFDGTCVSNCSPTINVSISVQGIDMQADYAGTITQSGGVTITVGTAGWVQAGGTFQGGSGTIFVSTTFTLSGGTFVSTSGTLDLESFVTWTIGEVDFQHNNGTVLHGRQQTIDVANASSTVVFYNFTQNVSQFGGTIGAGDTVIVLNTYTHTGGNILGGTIELYGNMVVGSASDSSHSTIISFVSTSTQTIVSSGGYTAILEMNKPSGEVSVTGNLGTDGLRLNSARFNSTSGTLSFGTGSFLTQTFGEFKHNLGTVSMGRQTSINGSSTLEFYNLIHDVTQFGGTIGSGDTVVVKNTYSHLSGPVTGSGAVLELWGDMFVGVNADGQSVQVKFVGTSTQYYTDQGGNELDGDITINKPSGSVILQSNADWNATGQDLTITSGTLVQSSSYSLSTGAVTVGTAGKWLATGTGTTTLGGNVTNNGLIDFRGNNTCGGPDAPVLQSSVNGTQRSWSGTGKVVMYDVRIRDQGGTLPITAYPCTSVSNNAANWTFSTAQCPFLNPVLQIKGGEMRINSGQVRVQ